MSKRRLCLVAAMCLLGGCAHENVRTAEAFRAAKALGDFDAARSYLVPGPRTWYEAKEGDGIPWTVGGRGRWADWDEEFRSESIPGPWQVGDRQVSCLVDEMNDYYRLIERGPGVYVHTYFFDDEGRISGQMISAPPGRERPPDRFNEFEAWARANAPDELEYLRPDGRLDPTGDRARRTRVLVNRWRASVGLAPIER